MSKRDTKAARILNDSAMRLEAARLEEQVALSKYNLAKGIRMAIEGAHNALEKELTPTPRKSSKKPAASQAAPKEQVSDTDAKCAICGNPPDHADHDRIYLKSHEFEGPKPVARASRKSRVKSETIASIPSTEGETESVTSASNAGD